MRASRAYIAGLGTTTVLVGGAVLLLVVVSALFAFRGWGPGEAGEEIAAMIVGDPPASLPREEPLRTARASPTGAADPAPPAPRRSVAASARGRAPAASRDPGGGGPVTAGGDGGTAGDQRAGGGGVDLETAPRTVRAPEPRFEDPPPVTAPPARKRRLGLDGVPQLTVGVGDLTEGLTGGLGGTVGVLEPGLGGAITDIGQGLSDLVGGLGAPSAGPG